MSAAENIATAKRRYAAFAAGDAAAAMADTVDDIEWITPGNSAISGATHGAARACGARLLAAWGSFRASGAGWAVCG